MVRSGGAKGAARQPANSHVQESKERKERNTRFLPSRRKKKKDREASPREKLYFGEKWLARAAGGLVTLRGRREKKKNEREASCERKFGYFVQELRLMV